jgi:hypothetical protein
MGQLIRTGPQVRAVKTRERQAVADTSTQGQPEAMADEPLSASASDASARTGWQAIPARLAGTVRVHWQFSLVLLVAVCIRIVVVLGYPQIMWFPDSFNYFQDAVTHVPDEVRPNGYPFFLSLLLPLHSMYPVALLQAAMGVAMGILTYALLRRRGLPWWGGTLAAIPVLFDAFEMQLEHMVTADILFTFLLTAAVVIACWNDRPSVPALAVVGVMIGYATFTRSVGMPLLVVVLVCMLLRRVGWRRLAAVTIAGIVPVAAYMAWFNGTYGKYALTESGGAFLYSRVQTFVECSKIKMPADLRFLCDPRLPDQRWPSQEYLWANYEMPPYAWQETPLMKQYGSDNTLRFKPQASGLMEKFAKRAILTQPVTYSRVVINDFFHTFGWNRQADPNNWFGNGSEFRFTDTPAQVVWWACGPIDLKIGCTTDNLATKQSAGDPAAVTLNKQLTDWLGPGAGQTTAVHPWAGFLQWYQNFMYFRGTLLGLALLIGLGGVLARWRRWGGIGLLPWLTGLLLILIPPATAGFSYRYVVAAVPVTCLAAGLAFARRPGGPSFRTWMQEDLPRYFGRSVPVNED